MTANDDFNRSDGAIGANWTDLAIPGGSAPAIIDSVVRAATDMTLAAAYWSAEACPDNQFSTLLVTRMDGWTGPLVRASSSGATRNYYVLTATAAAMVLNKVVAGSSILLASLSRGSADSTAFTLSAVDSALQCFAAGGQVGIDQSDSALTSGSFGFIVFEDVADWLGQAVDNWSGGEASLVPPFWTTLGPNSGSTFSTTVDGGDVDWTAPENASASDAAYATCVCAGAGQSYRLQVGGFQFAVPTSAQIRGIQLDVQRLASVGAVITETVSVLTDGGGGSFAGAVWSTTEDYYTYGDATYLWGRAWTPANINSSLFRMYLWFNTSAPVTASVNHVRITVYYMGSNQPQGVTKQFQVGDGMSVTERHTLIRQH